MFLEQFLIGNLWNACLICMMLGLKRLLRNRLSLRFQYRSWFVLACSLFLSFLPNGIWSAFQSAKSVGQRAFAISNTSINTPVVATEAGWLQDTTELIARPENSRFIFIASFLWLAGVLASIIVYLVGIWRLYTIKHLSVEPSYACRKRFDECQLKLGLKRHIKLLQSRFITTPISFGWKTSFVVLPKGGIDGLPKSELDHILLHELTHIKHGDTMTNYLLCVIQILFWCNPLVWLALRQIRRDREAYCDWDVMNEMTCEKERIAYGQTILRFAAVSNSPLHIM